MYVRVRTYFLHVIICKFPGPVLLGINGMTRSFSLSCIPNISTCITASIAGICNLTKCFQTTHNSSGMRKGSNEQLARWPIGDVLSHRKLIGSLNMEGFRRYCKRWIFTPGLSTIFSTIFSEYQHHFFQGRNSRICGYHSGPI